MYQLRLPEQTSHGYILLKLGEWRGKKVREKYQRNDITQLPSIISGVVVE